MWKCPKCGRSFSREGQGHYCGKIETVDQYIEEQDEKVRPYLREVRQIIRSAIPEAQEKISWSMPTYWKGQNLIHFAASKKHLGLYPGGEATTVFGDRLANYDVSKGTIRLPYTKPLPKDLIAEIAVWCYGQYAEDSRPDRPRNSQSLHGPSQGRRRAGPARHRARPGPPVRLPHLCTAAGDRSVRRMPLQCR